MISGLISGLWVSNNIIRIKKHTTRPVLRKYTLSTLIKPLELSAGSIEKDLVRGDMFAKFLDLIFNSSDNDFEIHTLHRDYNIAYCLKNLNSFKPN